MELPSSEECRTCRSIVPIHDLRQCSDCKGSHGTKAPYYCIRNCRFCRATDFQKSDCTDRQGHVICYERHLPREIDPLTPHKPLDLLQKLYVDAVTYSEGNKGRQEIAHDADRVAQWFTIKSDPIVSKLPRLVVTDRFRDLCSPGDLPRQYSSKQFPGFVSFIGDTGSGKSTLLRAMILMGYLESYGNLGAENEKCLESNLTGLRRALSQSAYGPVSKSGSADHMTDPTSFGVHLYKDMAAPINSGEESGILMRDTPIMFADCEGFRAGLTLTNAQRAGLSESPNIILDSPITAKSYGVGGKYGIDLFYARFLYAVSDVVVLIMSSDGEFFTDMQRLMEWAASALYRSVNHLAQKTLIVVRNKGTTEYQDLLESKKLERNLLESLMGPHATPLWMGSPSLERFVTEFNSKQHENVHKILDNNNLLGKFFVNRLACNIPDTRTTSSEVAFKQYRVLRSQIVDAFQRSQALRARNWMQFNVPTLSHILNHALEHFRTSDEPFDFFLAARNDNPSPKSTSEHISNFIRHLKLLPVHPEKMIPVVIATHLVTWSTSTIRDFVVVREPDEIFQRVLKDQFDAGIARYKERDQRCGRKVRDGGVCIKRRPTHAYEHCDSKAKTTPGLFDEAYALPLDITNRVHDTFLHFYQQLCTDQDGVFSLPTKEKIASFRKEHLQNYKTYWKLVFSNKSCLGCLQAVPDHVLDCGHAFCDKCVQELGSPSDFYEYGWVMSECVLCQSSWHDNRHLVRLNPRCAGVRVLSLDGGGVRGIIEIDLLERVHADIDLNIPLRDCFDLIMGTSTGGIVALGLSTLPDKLTIKDLKGEFIKVATEAFKKRRGQFTSVNIFKWTTPMFLIMRVWDSMYPTTPLRLGLQKLFNDRKLFSSSRRDVRVAVTSAKDNGKEKCLVTNYNRPTPTDEGLDFEREDEASKEMEIWEAALATASAPFYFRKFEKAETGKNYVDGALHSNFPVRYALEEYLRIWKTPGQQDPSLDILLSVGTGEQKREIHIPTPLRIGGFEAICTTFHNNLDSHRKWLDFERVHLKGRPLGKTIHRLNVPIDGDYVSLDDYDSIPRLEQCAKIEMETTRFKTQSDTIAKKISAALFYFEPSAAYLKRSSRHKQEENSIDGAIRCRLARTSMPLKELVRRTVGFWSKEIQNEDAIHDARGWDQIPFSSSQRSDVRNNGWLCVDCTIQPVERNNALQVIGVSWSGDQRVFPISGFPVPWNVLKDKAKAS